MTTGGKGRAVRIPPAPARLSPAEWLPGVAAVVGVLALWQVSSEAGVLNPRHVPTMLDTVAELLAMSATASFWLAVWQTIQGWALGLGIALALAVPLGIAIGSSFLAYRALRVPIEFLRPIPAVALVPVALLIYGAGLESKVLLATFAAFWPLLIQTIYGVQDVDPLATDMARSFGLGRLRRLWSIALPGAVPYIATGARISSAIALILAVTAELVIGIPGLGRDINLARSGGALPTMYALIIATGVLGVVLNGGATWLERRALHWHPSYRETTS